MGETTFIVIDTIEKRVTIDHYAKLDSFIAAICKDPSTINQFDQYFSEIRGEPFYTDGNLPKVTPYDGPNYQTFMPFEHTSFDIPSIETLIEVWNKVDPEHKDFPTVEDYRRLECNDGIFVAELTRKELRYVSYVNDHIPRTQLKGPLTPIAFQLPDDWKLIRE